MSNSEASFYGTGSLSPTTDDIRSFSKRPDPRVEEKSISDPLSKGGQRSQSTERAKKPQDVSIKVNKGIQFTVQKVPSGKALTAGTIARRSCYILLGIVIAFVVVAFFVMFVIIPLVFSTNLNVRRKLMFVGWIRNAPNELKHPRSVGLPCSSNLPIISEGKVAAWYIPASGKEPCEKKKPFEGQRPAVLFVPSFEEARSNPSTVAMLKILSQNLSYHILAFDYMGTADSGDALPSTATVLSDAINAYKTMANLMLQANNTDKVIIWGNTWGAAVALKLANSLQKELPGAQMMVLQSPIESTIKAAGSALSFNLLWRWTPFFEKAFVEPLQRNSETNLNSLKIVKDSTPLATLVVHAADDDVVDINQGRNVYQALKKANAEKGSPGRIDMFEIPENQNVGHMIARSRDLANRVKNFIATKTTTVPQTIVATTTPHISTTIEIVSTSMETLESSQRLTIKTTEVVDPPDNSVHIMAETGQASMTYSLNFRK